MTREISTPKAALDREYQYGQRWDFTKLPKRQSATAVVTAGANANDDVTAFPFFLTGARPILVVDAFCVASANSTALAAGDLSTWTITTLGGTSVAALARASDFVADTDVNMGAITSGYVAASDGLKLGIVNGTNADLNSAVCAVTVGYYDALDIMDGWPSSSRMAAVSLFPMAFKADWRLLPPMPRLPTMTRPTYSVPLSCTSSQRVRRSKPNVA